MNRRWSTKPLAELCEFRNGLWKGKKPPYVYVGVIRNTNFNADGSLDESDIAFLHVEATQFKSRELEFGDIILEKSGGGPKQPVGRVITFEKRNGLYSFSNFTSVIRVRDPDALDYRYLHRVLFWYYTSGVTEGMQRRSTGIRNLEFNAYKQLEIPVPPLPEQQRIVAILDEAFDAIATATANAERNLQNARALFDSYLQGVFSQRGEGWVDKTIDEIAEHSLGKMLDKAKNKGTPQQYLRNVNVRWFVFDLTDLGEMRFLPDEAEKYTAVKGDVIICEGGYPGRSAIWDQDYPMYFQKALHRVRFHEPEHNIWFVYYMYAQDRSNALRQYFTGTGIQHFTGRTLSKFLLPIPPLAQLRTMVSDFEELSKETQRLETIYQRKLTALDELKQSLLHQAFAGEL